jgi:hypothetical protein
LPGGGEAGHVGADLSQDHLGGAMTHSGDPDQQRHRRLVRVQERLDSGGELVDGGVGLIDAGQHRPAQQGMVLVETARQRVLELRDLGSHGALGHLGQHRRVTLTGDERVDHLPTRLGQHRRRHR